MLLSTNNRPTVCKNEFPAIRLPVRDGSRSPSRQFPSSDIPEHWLRRLRLSSVPHRGARVKASTGSADDPLVAKKQLRDYESWREATELTDEERAVRLPSFPVAADRVPVRRRHPRRETPEPLTLHGRLAHVRDPAEAARILGRRRLAWYAFSFTAVALAFGGFAVYLIAEVALGRKYTWTLAMLPASLAVSAFSILLAYGGWSWVVTGRRWPRASRLDRIFGILNNTYASQLWPK